MFLAGTTNRQQAIALQYWSQLACEMTSN